MNKKQRVHVFFSGQVQGVGFRFTAERIADRLGLVGFVRNLPDGRVELTCEGSNAALSEFLNEINCSMGAYISDSLVSWDDSIGEFLRFEIRCL